MAVSGNLGGKVPVIDNVLSSPKNEIHPTTPINENCIKFEFQTERNYYAGLRQSYLPLKLEKIKGRGYKT